MKTRLFALALLLLLPVIGLSAQESNPEPAPPGVTIHVVQRGENLFRIALSYGLTTEEVARANGISNPASILVGQRLIIPLGNTPPEPQPQTHTIQPGESLQSIADLYGLPMQELAVRNGIANPNTIFVGQELLIREAEAVAPVAESVPTAESAQADANPGSGTIHIVAAGETLFRIATNYGVTLADIQSANGITDPTLIYAGQEIIIPGVEPPPLALDLPPSITAIDLNPQFLTEGKTSRIRITTSIPVDISASLLGTAPPVVAETDTSYVALLAVPLGTEADIYPLVLTVTPRDGSPADSITLNVQVLNGGYGNQYITLPADRMGLLDINIENAEVQILNSVMTFNPERYFTGPMSLPAAAPMNAPYGAFRAYNGGPFDRYHTGADFAGAPGTPVLAAAPGRIVLSDILNIRGQTLVIDHGWGIYTAYAHLSQRIVTLGDVVQTGQTIGLVGSSGRSTGAHLHWEIWVNTIPVDPMQWLRQAFP